MTRNAFTLLEIVLALALAAVVLSILGMAVDIHLSSADAGRIEVEQAQLARALLHRMAGDLRAALPYSESAGTGGLTGTMTELQVCISRLPRSNRASEGGMAADVLSDSRTVVYGVADPLGSLYPEMEETASDRSGLLRSELGTAAFTMAAEQGEASDLLESAEALAREVLAVEFTYFDGGEPRMEWDSQVEGRLPVAVGITVYFRRPDRRRPKLSVSQPETEARVMTYSLVVELPNAQVSAEGAGASGTSPESEGDTSESGDDASDTGGNTSGGTGNTSGGTGNTSNSGGNSSGAGDSRSSPNTKGGR